MKKSETHVAQCELQSADEQIGEPISLTAEQLDTVAAGFAIIGEAFYGLIASLRPWLSR